MDQPAQDFFRYKLRLWLGLLQWELSHHEIKTVGSPFLEGAELKDVLEGVQEAYENPCAQTITDLDARLAGFLKKERAP